MNKQLITESRKMVRQVAQMSGTSCPICVKNGRRAPHVMGDWSYFTTPSGKTIVRHPHAYHWPTVYHCSTLRIEVGAQWLARRQMAVNELPATA